MNPRFVSHFLFVALFVSCSALTHEECQPLLTPVSLHGHATLLGRLNTLVGYSDDKLFVEILKKTESSWLNITSSTSDTNMLEMFEENNINGKCFSAQNNLTIDGNTVTAHYANITTLFHVLPSSDSVVAFSANSTITGDIDVLLNFFNITTTTKQEEGAIHSLYLMGRETTAANDSDLEHFKKQAKCLGFDHEPVFIYDSNKGFCAKDKVVSIVF
uniref:uncharacterized protein LOC122786636 n=1 Tax=Solea senegalensis TaxID=28829 RepID=UPI001CD8F84E|nr:uncharacterized protein LOC122786636 [Solea senegalensis]